MAATASPSKALLLATAHELQQKLASGTLSSVELVEAYLAQIERHNRSGLDLHALISVCPKDIVLAQAKKFDQEREQGNARGRLHGMPIVLKDAVVTDPALGMPSTVGSAVFASLKAKKNAELVDRLVDAGVIILGKANMSEFCGHKSKDAPVGWSASGGPTRSAYYRKDLDEKEQPWAGGSSSGSATSIAAGFSPLSIGTETGGSNVLPASLGGLYGMTISAGAVPDGGVFKISESFDRIGAMARDPWDLAALVGILTKDEARCGLPGPSTAMDDFWRAASIGVLDITWSVHKSPDTESPHGKWDLPAVRAAYEGAVAKMRAKGAKVVYPLEAAPSETLKVQGADLKKIAYYEFRETIAKFISSSFETDPSITNLKDVIAWNEEHADEAMPAPYTNQSELIESLNSTMTDETHDAVMPVLRRLADQDGIGKAMIENGVDILITGSEASLVSFAAIGGWPISTVPLGNLEKNRQPFGLFAMARAGQEDLLLRFMAAFWQAFPAVERPTEVFE